MTESAQGKEKALSQKNEITKKAYLQTNENSVHCTIYGLRAWITILATFKKYIIALSIYYTRNRR